MRKEEKKAKFTRLEDQSQRKNLKRSSKKLTKTWSHEETLALIAIWENYELLYNVKHQDYSNKVKKINALKSMQDDLKETGIEVSVDDIQSKMHSLRVYFSSQRSKYEASKKSGAGADQIYKIKWPFYESLSYLHDNLIPRNTFSNIVAHDSSDQNGDVYTCDKPPSAKSKRKIEVNKRDQLMESAIAALNREPTITESKSVKTPDELFCDMLCSSLLKIKDGPRKEFLKVELHRQVVVEAFNTNQQNSFAEAVFPQPRNRYEQQQYPVYSQQMAFGSSTPSPCSSSISN